MPKQIISFVCQECGYDSPAYLGKCPECGSWNSFKEIKLGPRVKGERSSLGSTIQLNAVPEPLIKVSRINYERISTGFSEMDGVLGGGIVPGSVMLLAGDPGIGKSTMLLQLCLNLASPKDTKILSNKDIKSESKEHLVSQYSNISISSPKVLYVSGEESKEQVSMRAGRLIDEEPGTRNQGSGMLDNLLLLSMTNTDAVVRAIEDTKPSIVIIDSIQTMESENGGGLSGSVSQIRYASTQFIRSAKQNNIPFILVGHVTKEGMVAGPMTLSHMVDTVLFLEGEKLTRTRVLRSLKNRFGPVDEVGIFLMEEKGMIEVKNPEQVFLREQQANIPGSVLVAIMEGSRPFLVEIQALVVYSKFPMPRRVASGVDSRRVELLLAVLQKHCRLPLENYDVFVNIAGGARVTDPAVDLGICMAVYSSLRSVPLHKTVCIAEVGLLGELRKVPSLEKRVKEAKKLGFNTIVSAGDFKTLPQVLEGLGGKEPAENSWEETDARHWRVKGKGR